MTALIGQPQILPSFASERNKPKKFSPKRKKKRGEKEKKKEKKRKYDAWHFRTCRDFPQADFGFARAKSFPAGTEEKRKEKEKNVWTNAVPLAFSSTVRSWYWKNLRLTSGCQGLIGPENSRFCIPRSGTNYTGSRKEGKSLAIVEKVERNRSWVVWKWSRIVQYRYGIQQNYPSEFRRRFRGPIERLKRRKGREMREKRMKKKGSPFSRTSVVTYSTVAKRREVLVPPR